MGIKLEFFIIILGICSKFDEIISYSHFSSVFEFSRQLDYNFNSTLHPYENCLLKSDMWNFSKRLSEQDRCLQHKLPFVDLEISTNLSWGHIPRSCLIGTGTDIQGNLTGSKYIQLSAHSKCKTPHITNRKNLLSIWKSSKSEVPLHNMTSSFFNTIVKSNISNIVLLGDSVVVQLARFFGCDFHRHGVKVLFYEYLLRMAHAHHQQAIFEWRNHRINWSTQRLMIPCTFESGSKTDNCTTLDSKQITIYNWLKTALYSSISSTSNNRNIDNGNIIIINLGHHIHKDTRDFIIPSSARAILNFAKETTQKTIVFFLETSATSFHGTVSGLFDGRLQPSIPPEPGCCVQSENMTAIDEDDWRNRMYWEAFQEEDPEWRRWVHWLPFFNLTWQLWDLHIEGTSFNRVDCTHFIYQPDMFSPILKQVEEQIQLIITLKNQKYQWQSQHLWHNQSNMTLLQSILQRVNVTGKLVRGRGVYPYLIENGKKRLVKVVTSRLRKTNWNFQMVERVDDGVLAEFPSAEDIVANGTSCPDPPQLLSYHIFTKGLG